MATKTGIGQITLQDLTDGYSVNLTSENAVFSGGDSGVPTGLSATTQITAYTGAVQMTNVSVTKADITLPTGITADVQNSGTSTVSITFTTGIGFTTPCSATIPVVITNGSSKITMNKKFSFTEAPKGNTGATGAAGKSITGVTNYYLASSLNTGVKTSDDGWTPTMQATDTTKKYLWCYQSIAYSSGSPTTTVPVIIGTHGATGGTGATGKGISKVENYYLTTASASNVTVDTSGWSKTPTATDTTKKYIWCYQLITYTDTTASKTTPAIIGTHGATGATGSAGADSIAVFIYSSGPQFFRNNTGSTTLTAMVTVGGVEQTITAAGVCGSLGSIKWYKDSGTTPIATAKSITVTADDIDGQAVYWAKLE